MRITYSHLAVAVVASVVTYGVIQKPTFHPGPLAHAAEESGPGAQQAVADPVAARQPAQETLDISPEEQTNVDIYQKVNRSVVNITTRSVQIDDFLLLSGPREGSGSGSVLDKNGHIVTNYHVVEEARQIAVTLYDSSSHEAKLVGSDPTNDLAVLKIDAPAEKLFPITWGDSTRLLVGLKVFAIGNPFGLERTLTTGIISSLNRSLRSENKYPDRRGHQPRQLGRPALEPPW